MRHIRTFSRHFPKGHPRQDEPTYFVEKFYNSLYAPNNLMDYPVGLEINESIREQKHHTIRAGHHINVGDTISFRVWSDKPYRSKQIVIAPDVEIKKTWNFEIYHRHNSKADLSFRFENIPVVAKNDGLELIDFMHWFTKPFDGQIICWNSNINY